MTDRFIESEDRVITWEFSDEYKNQYPVEKVSINVQQLIYDAASQVKFKNLDDANRYYERILFRKGVPFKMADKKGKMDIIYVFGEDDSDWYGVYCQ
ncbi:MAG: hypothetical protein ACOYU4_12680 [Thermodesulfobacteriota bacterium]